MNSGYLQLRRSSPKPGSVLLSRTSPAMQRKIADFARTGKMKLSAGKDSFFMTWAEQKVLSPRWPHALQAVTIQAVHAKQTCGYAYFARSPFSQEIDQEVGLIMSLENVLTPKFQNPVASLWPSPLTLRVAHEYQQEFGGLERSLIALCLHLAASQGLPYMSAHVGFDPSSPFSRQSFYDHYGFYYGVEMNIVMLRHNMKDFIHHSLEEKVFYLNGMFDGVTDFVIPEVGIFSR